MVELFTHQATALERTKDLTHVAYYHDMGLGKTFTGAEKLVRLGDKINLVICQKSKIEDWKDHFKTYYPNTNVYDLTKKKELDAFLSDESLKVGIINYELSFRRTELAKLNDFTLMLDESSLIQNDKAKRTRFILKLHPTNVILLSGTPTGGKYENLWSQLRLLGWNISKQTYWNQFIDYRVDTSQGFPLIIVKGYKNVERLKEKMDEYGCCFLKTSEVFDLPKQIFQDIHIDITKEYKRFRKDRIIEIEGNELVGDTTLTKMLYERVLCGQYNKDKMNALKDLIESTDDRIIVFYNFNQELRAIENLCLELNRPLSIVSGHEKDLSLYDEYPNSVTAIQYQAGSMGLNLQKANKIVYFTPPLSSELYEQSKKRIHRIGQESTCFYYRLICKGSIEERIYSTLALRRNYTNALFERDETS